MEVNYIKQNTKRTKLLVSIIYTLFFVVSMGLSFLPKATAVMATMDTAADSDVTNSAGFSTDTIYQIVTDRFFDGDSTNNPTGDIYDKTDNRKYHGGDWAGITQKLNDGYLTGLGISAIWISSPVENIATIDPSNNSAAYHGYWAKDFFRTNPYFGSLQDFQTMVNTAHSKEITMDTPHMSLLMIWHNIILKNAYILRHSLRPLNIQY